MAEHDNPSPEENPNAPTFSMEQHEWIEQLVANSIAMAHSVGLHISISTFTVNATGITLMC